MPATQNRRPGLREVKRARLKLSLLQAAVRQMGHHRGGLVDLPVEAICGEVEVSRVTFFNYFPHKADLLNYFLRVWCLERAVEQLRTPLTGLRALERIFLRGAEAREASAVFLNLIGWIASLSAPPPAIEITEAERFVLYPDEPEVARVCIPHLRDLLARHTAEARANGEIKTRLPERDLVALFLTLLYGAPLALHVTGEKDLHKRYRTHFQLLVAALQ
jgi:AcrR family transcriptional regulator